MHKINTKFLGRIMQLLGLVVFMDALIETMHSAIHNIIWYTVLSTWVLAIIGVIFLIAGALIELRELE
jgi:uncharacterized membrane protein